MLKILSILAYLAMVGGILALVASRNLFSPSPVTISLQLVAVVLMVWARVTFGRRSFHLAANPTGGGLVTTGPYRYIRHPIYAAVCLFVAAAVGAHWAGPAALLGGLVLAGALVRLFSEERLLVEQYPEYRAYASRTWRLLPYVF